MIRCIPHHNESITQNLQHHSLIRLHDAHHDREVAGEDEVQISQHQELRNACEAGNVGKQYRDDARGHLQAGAKHVTLVHDVAHHGLRYEAREALNSTAQPAERRLQLGHVCNPGSPHLAAGGMGLEVQLAQFAHQVGEPPEWSADHSPDDQGGANAQERHDKQHPETVGTSLFQAVNGQLLQRSHLLVNFAFLFCNASAKNLRIENSHRQPPGAIIQLDGFGPNQVAVRLASCSLPRSTMKGWCAVRVGRPTEIRYPLRAGIEERSGSPRSQLREDSTGCYSGQALSFRRLLKRIRRRLQQKTFLLRKAGRYLVDQENGRTVPAKRLLVCECRHDVQRL
mmetsp:Transcript_1376/g.3530  ORF Transcript_1376/g.3530 Transcript_1376/m.3530 type:complete len:340 (+) Transcript_1376:992-2011(+)